MHNPRPRSAKSVEDIVDHRRVSSLSTTSGCSDCTTATLQGAKSYGSSFFSGEEMATPRLLGSGSGDNDDTSISSNEEFSSSHSQVSRGKSFQTAALKRALLFKEFGHTSLLCDERRPCQ